MQEFLILLFTLLIKVLNVQVSDTTSDAICSIAGIFYITRLYSTAANSAPVIGAITGIQL